MTSFDKSSLCQMVIELARILVARPEDVHVTLIEDAGLSTFQVRAHREDLGRLVGAGGRTVRALEALVNASAGKLKCRVAIEILEQQ